MAVIRRRKIYLNQAINPQENLSKYNRPAVISSVNTEKGTCTLRWLDNPGGRVDVLLTQGSWGEYNMPIVGAIVLVQLDNYDQARIVRYLNLNQAQRQKTPDEGGKGTLPKLKAGEKFWESGIRDASGKIVSGGAYIYMNNSGKISLVSPFDDIFEIDPDITTISGKTVNWQIVSGAGTEKFGQIRRWVQDGTQSVNKIISDDIPTVQFPDGTPLTEYTLTVTDKYQASTPICKVKIGTVVNDDGKVIDKDGNIVTADNASALAVKIDIQSNHGSLGITIDKSGKFYITSPRIVETCSDIRLGSENVTESAVLGNKLKTQLENLIDSITSLTVPTAFGPSGTPINSSAFTSIKNQLSSILSQKVKLE